MRACGSTSTACSRSATSPRRSSARSRASAPSTGAASRACCRDASTALSALSRYAGIVTAPINERPFKHVEFVPLSPGRALVIVVGDNGMVENRVIDVPLGMSVSTLVEAGNYLTARLAGRSFAEARAGILAEIEQHRSQLDALTQKVVSAGLATWGGDPGRRDGGLLIVRGHAKLLEDVTNLADLERIRGLFEMLEARESILRLVELTQSAQEHADLHRRGEPAVRPVRLHDDRGPLHRRAPRAGAAPRCWARSA